MYEVCLYSNGKLYVVEHVCLTRIDNPQLGIERRLVASGDDGALFFQQVAICYDAFCRVRRIGYTDIRTFQGQKEQSANGCTVIASLCAAKHLREDIDTSTVEAVINNECIPHLLQIRETLSIEALGYIEIHDVIEHLTANGMFREEQHQGTAGSNILNPDHVRNFIELLADGNDKRGQMKRGAATFLFHGHVVCIVKIVSSCGIVTYDVIDSLEGYMNRGNSTRTHCQDLQSLKVYLMWYCSRHLNGSDYTREWDAANGASDSRVFQADVWLTEPTDADKDAQRWADVAAKRMADMETKLIADMKAQRKDTNEATMDMADEANAVAKDLSEAQERLADEKAAKRMADATKKAPKHKTSKSMGHKTAKHMTDKTITKLKIDKKAAKRKGDKKAVKGKLVESHVHDMSGHSHLVRDSADQRPDDESVDTTTLLERAEFCVGELLERIKVPGPLTVLAISKHEDGYIQYKVKPTIGARTKVRESLLQRYVEPTKFRKRSEKSYADPVLEEDGVSSAVETLTQTQSDEDILDDDSEDDTALIDMAN